MLKNKDDFIKFAQDNVTAHKANNSRLYLFDKYKIYEIIYTFKVIEECTYQYKSNVTEYDYSDEILKKIYQKMNGILKAKSFDEEYDFKNLTKVKKYVNKFYDN